MEQLENAMLQPRIEHIIDYDKYDDYIEHLAEKEDEYYDEIIFEEMNK